MPMDLAELWARILDELKTELPQPIYMNWFESALIPMSYKEGVLLLAASQQFIVTYITKNYTNKLNEIAEQIVGQPVQVRLTLPEQPAGMPPDPEPAPVQDTMVLPDRPEPSPAAPAAHSVPEPRETASPDLIQDEIPGIDPYHTEAAAKEPPLTIRDAVSVSPPPSERMKGTHLIANYTFENFIVGNSNRVAYAMATGIAEDPENAKKNSNPFYIYGGSGLGKTHLMHAIGHGILHKFPQMRLRCITSEDFVNDFIQSLKEKSTDKFRSLYRNVDVLLVDDIQFLGDGEKDSSKEEFFHTFNKLYQDQKLMIFTSDRPPQNIKSMEDRLRSRFQSGTVTEIKPPDLETRTAILRAWVERDHIGIESDALNYIASNVSDNIRDLHGAYNNVVRTASITKKPITLELTKNTLQYLIKEAEEEKYFTIEDIITAVCEFYNVNYKELMGKKKTKDIALPRQIAMYLSRELTGNTYPHIGTFFNGRDHTTVMHACVKIMKMMDKDSRFKEAVEKLKSRITGVDK